MNTRHKNKHKRKQEIENAREKIKEITDKLEQGIKDLFLSGKYEEYLKAMSKFYNYSFGNVLLILMQKPDATLVAGYSAWRTKFKRQVKSGEKGIAIIAPSPYKVQVEMEIIDPLTQKPNLDLNGDVQMQAVDIQRQGFKIATVFDVSQTEGEPVPSLGVNELTGDVEEYQMFFEILREVSPVPIEFKNIITGAKGYYHVDDKLIVIQENMSQVQTIKTAIHEISHAKLHAYKKAKKLKIETPAEPDIPEELEIPIKDKRTKEVEAEAIAYIVCQHFKIDTSEYSFGYIAGWSSDKELPQLKASLETIKETAAEFITGITEKQSNCQQAFAKAI